MKTLALVTALSFAPFIYAADADNGEILYKETEFSRMQNGQMRDDFTCGECHTATDFTKPDRKADSYRAVHYWVDSCNNAMSVTWFPDEVDDVTAYMNREYYKFPAE